MLFTERNTFFYTRVLCIKRSVKYDIPPFATIRRLAKLLVACPSAIREIGQTNRLLRSTQGDTARSCKWPERPTRVVGAVTRRVRPAGPAASAQGRVDCRACARRPQKFGVLRMNLRFARSVARGGLNRGFRFP